MLPAVLEVIVVINILSFYFNPFIKTTQASQSLIKKFFQFYSLNPYGRRSPIFQTLYSLFKFDRITRVLSSENS